MLLEPGLIGLGRPKANGDGWAPAPGIRHEVRELARLLEESSLQVVLQPVLTLQPGGVLGYEALIRGPKTSSLHAPDRLVHVAQQVGWLPELEMAAREASIARFTALGLDGLLFLNATPAVLPEPDLGGPGLLGLLARYGLEPERVVVEVSEAAPDLGRAAVTEALRGIQAAGMGLALDDMGAGSTAAWPRAGLSPDFAKLDPELVRDLAQDDRRRQLVFSLCEIARALDARVVGKGVETRAELEELETLGVTLGQGFLLAPPQRQHYPGDEDRLVAALPASRSQPLRSEPVDTIRRTQPAVAPDLSLEETVAFLRSRPGLETVAVVSDGHPVGVLRRNATMNLYVSRFGRDLYGTSPIARFMAADFRVARGRDSVESLSQRITDNEGGGGWDDFVIVDDAGHYLGIGTLRDLLRKITRLQVRNARHANPLTGLPGNVPINDWIDRLIGERHEFVVAYCDLDHFKPLNDYYGYARGDRIIRYVAEVLAAHTDPERDFVGHVGGDDFVVVWRSPDWEARCRAILEQIEADVPGFYDATERACGGIQAKERTGGKAFFPFVSLSIGAVPAPVGRFSSFQEVASEASEVKARAKEQSGNALFVDRRHEAPYLAPAQPNAEAPVG